MALSRPALWSAADAVVATGGEAIGDWAATGVSIDSRTVMPGDLFVALKGPSHDGHTFVAQALAQGAAAAMIDHPIADLPESAPLLLVADTLDGLVGLGLYARLPRRAAVVAVTGSVGKTSTKEMLRLGLSAQAATHASIGNLNNHWGVPLSLARMPAGATYGVFELGMNHAGEIAVLSQQVKPDVAIITAVEPVHIEFFPSVEAIADAKAEIFAGMSPPGAAILNRDNAHFPRLVAHARTRGISRVWSFGEHEEADARLIDCSLHASSSAVTADIKGEIVQYSIGAPGRHLVANSLAMLLAVRALGADVATAARELARIEAIKGRGQRRVLALGGEPLVLIDESYNASPPAVGAALKVLAEAKLPDGKSPARRVAVLGDMLELGARARALHLALKSDLVAAGIDLVFCCGPHMSALFEALPPCMQGGAAPDSDALVPIVTQALRGGDVVMVKGSLGTKMAPLVAAIDAMAGSTADRRKGG
ncbi:MAG: UDP-N-acetylmuramoylalanyl-D-glutamyl-2,6-diaminopimelate--D-alanyl-D-alanine ligase [Azospirillaceae bacterium]